MNFPKKENFEEKWKEICNKLKEDTQVKFNEIILKIEEITNALNDFKNSYENIFKQDLITSSAESNLFCCIKALMYNI